MLIQYLNRLFKNLLVIGLLFFTSCFSYSTYPSSSSDYTPVSYIEEYSELLSSNENTAKHVDYFLNAYESSNKNEALWGAQAITYGEMLKILYDSSIKSFSDTTNQFLSCIELTQEVINIHLSYYSDIWSDAISKDSKTEFSNVDFREALLISKFELKRMGVFEKLDNIEHIIQEKVLAYDKNEYVNTYEAYGLISQLISMANDPSGSLFSFNQTKNKVDLELKKNLSLAKLEHIK